MKEHVRSWAGWAEAFTIFAKYDAGNKHYDEVAAEHDIVYAGPDPKEVTVGDVVRLEELGWAVCSEFDCFSRFT